MGLVSEHLVSFTISIGNEAPNPVDGCARFRRGDVSVSGSALGAGLFRAPHHPKPLLGSDRAKAVADLPKQLGWQQAVRDPVRRSGAHVRSFTTTRDRSSSRPRRCLVAGGISTASAGRSGTECVTGATVTTVWPSISRTARMMTQGRSFTSYSRPHSCSDNQR